MAVLMGDTWCSGCNHHDPEPDHEGDPLEHEDADEDLVLCATDPLEARLPFDRLALHLEEELVDVGQVRLEFDRPEIVLVKDQVVDLGRHTIEGRRRRTVLTGG